MEEKFFRKTLWKKGEIAENEQFYFFPRYFLRNLSLKNHLIATVQLSSAASLNFGRSQNGILGNGLTHSHTMTF